LVALQLLSFIERITKELFSQFDFLSYLPTNMLVLNYLPFIMSFYMIIGIMSVMEYR
jgi:hypothetical protein